MGSAVTESLDRSSNAERLAAVHDLRVGSRAPKASTSAALDLQLPRWNQSNATNGACAST